MVGIGIMWYLIGSYDVLLLLGWFSGYLLRRDKKGNLHPKKMGKRICETCTEKISVILETHVIQLSSYLFGGSMVHNVHTNSWFESVGSSSQHIPTSFAIPWLEDHQTNCLAPDLVHKKLVWMVFQQVNFTHLEDHPRTCKWLITMVSKSPK